jgi:surfactin synthase thioesterase subunit
MPDVPSHLIFEPRPDATTHLYCLPYGGGSASVYRAWTRYLPHSYELRALHLPGWLHQPGQSPGTWQDLITPLVDTIERESTVPCVLFGHCMGALTAFHVAAEIHRRGAPPPLLLGLSGWPARGEQRMLKPFLDLSADQLVTWLGCLGGIPESGDTDRAVVNRMLEAARFDMQVCLDRPDPVASPMPALTCPIAAYTGAADSLIRPLHMESWAKHTTAFLGVTALPGNHFYLLHDQVHIVKALLADLRRLGAAHPDSTRHPKDALVAPGGQGTSEEPA